MDLRVLRSANVLRAQDAYHPIEAWSLTDWACAMAGEAGEVCNVVKKLRRLDGDSGFSRPTEATKELLDDLGKEIADTVIYLDLLAARAGIELNLCIPAKFNETSERVGSTVKLVP